MLGILASGPTWGIWEQKPCRAQYWQKLETTAMSKSVYNKDGSWNTLWKNGHGTFYTHTHTSLSLSQLLCQNSAAVKQVAILASWMLQHRLAAPNTPISSHLFLNSQASQFTILSKGGRIHLQHILLHIKWFLFQFIQWRLLINSPSSSINKKKVEQ